MPELTLYQAEWCPFSAAVREVLTELGIDYAIRQVEPWPEQRDALRAVAGTDAIPVLVTADGEVFRSTRAIFAYLRRCEPGRFAAAHRRRYADHQPARVSDATGEMLAFFDGTDGLEPTDGSPDETEVVDVPEASRYELRRDGRLVGLLAYRRDDGRIALTHTEIAAACEGRGFGSRLVTAALDDAGRQGLEVVPLCPFVAHVIRQRPEYARLVPR